MARSTSLLIVLSFGLIAGTQARAETLDVTNSGITDYNFDGTILS